MELVIETRKKEAEWKRMKKYVKLLQGSSEEKKDEKEKGGDK